MKLANERRQRYFEFFKEKQNKTKSLEAFNGFRHSMESLPSRL